MCDVHELKITPSNFNMVISKGMTFQIRKWERDYREGDILFLKEFKKEYFTGRTIPCKVNLMLHGAEGIQDGFVLLNIETISIHINKDGKRYVTNIRKLDKQQEKENEIK